MAGTAEQTIIVLRQGPSLPRLPASTMLAGSSSYGDTMQATYWRLSSGMSPSRVVLTFRVTPWKLTWTTRGVGISGTCACHQCRVFLPERQRAVAS